MDSTGGSGHSPASGPGTRAVQPPHGLRADGSTGTAAGEAAALGPAPLSAARGSRPALPCLPRQTHPRGSPAERSPALRRRPRPGSSASGPARSLPRRHHHVVDNEIARGQRARALPAPRLLPAVAVVRPAPAAPGRRHLEARAPRPLRRSTGAGRDFPRAGRGRLRAGAVQRGPPGSAREWRRARAAVRGSRPGIGHLLDRF